MSDSQQTDLIDHNFEGSIFQKLGFDKELCPHCRAHLYGGICFKACSLTLAEYRSFEAKLQKYVEQLGGENDDDVCPYCHGSALSPHPSDGGSCPHCFNGHVL